MFTMFTMIEDLLGLFKKATLTLKRKTHVRADIYSFDFLFPHTLTWAPGQHGMFILPKKVAGRSWRVFSIASTPEESIVRIATRITEKPTAFKRTLLEMEPGDEIIIRGPVGHFRFEHTNGPALLVVGGLGITPVRSLLIDAARNGTLPERVDLLFSDSNRQYLFQNELDELAESREGFRIQYLETRKSLQGKVMEYVEQNGNRSSYLISGPGPMVTSIRKQLVEKRIDKRNIRHDPFMGYN